MKITVFVRFAGVAQLVRASGSYPLGPGFKSLHRHHLSCSFHSTYRSTIPRLQYVSKKRSRFALVEQSNGSFNRCRTQMHIPLSGRQISMSRQLLDCPCWSAPHREMGAERVPQDVHAPVL